MDIRAVIFLLPAISYAVSATDNYVNQMSNLNNYKVTDDIPGQIVNCGTVPVNVTWTPKDLSPFGQIIVCLCYELPQNFTGGIFNFSMFIHDYTTFVFGLEGTLDCDDLKYYGIPFCPLPKGTSICHICPSFSDLHVLTHVPGTYDFYLQLWNLKHEEMFCVNATVTILENIPTNDCRVT